MPHRPRKRFGQNFLHDPVIIGRILDAVAAVPGQRLVEIGPGRGAITRGLLQHAGTLQAVELDRDLVAALEQEFAGSGLTIHSADALTFDFCSLACDATPLRIVGNLPYNISTPLLFRLLEQSRCIRDMHFMLQKEVVQRMAATPGSRTYGRLSVMLQLRCEVTPLFDIGPGAFFPPPRVDSSLVRLVPLPSPRFPVADPALFALLVTRAFGQRRKTLRNTLKELVDEDCFARAGVAPGDRAERLSVADFARLANAAWDSSDRHHVRDHE